MSRVWAQQPPRAEAAFDPPLVPAELAWKLSLDAAPSHAPVAAGDALVVPLRNGTLVALSLGRGSVLWTVDQPASAGPAADEDHVYAASEATLTARRLSSGEISWRKTLDAPIIAPVTVRAGWLLALDGTGALLAFRAADGELVWRQELTGDPTDHGPAVVGETVVVGRATGEIYAVNIRSGARLWRVTVQGRPGLPLLTDGRIIFGSTDNTLYCLDERSGRLVWRWRTGGDIRLAPVVDATHIYYVSLDNMLRAVDRASGNLRWKRALSARATTGLRLVSDQLLVSGLAPQLRAHRVGDGRPVGTVDIQTDLLAVSPVVVARPAPDYALCIVAGRDGSLFAYRPTLSLPTSPLDALPGLPAELVAPDSLIEATTEPR